MKFKKLKYRDNKSSKNKYNNFTCNNSDFHFEITLI